MKNYERDYSHYHCWRNYPKPSPCGQPLESHKQCCLCDTPFPKCNCYKHYHQVCDICQNSSPLNQAPEEKKCTCKKHGKDICCLACQITGSCLCGMSREGSISVAPISQAPESKEWEEKLWNEVGQHISLDEPFQKMWVKLHIMPALKSFIANQLDKWGQKEYNRGYEDGKNG